MSGPEHIRIADYDYPLPDGRIAKFPLERRDDAKLLVYKHGEITSSVFRDVCNYLPHDALMVMNNTRVIQARIHFRKATGALIEVFLLEPAEPADYERMFEAKGTCSWACLVGNLKKWREGTLCRQEDSTKGRVTLRATRGETRGTSQIVAFDWDNAELNWADVLEIAGELPIPPYLNRAAEEADKTTYQTVYSKIKGSVAAPTAGLHFTPETLAAVDRHGIHREEITLHVGAGTFRPVKSEEIAGHEMHTEYIAVHRETVGSLLRYGAKAIAVGTTTVRTLESLYYIGLKLHANPDLKEEELAVGQWVPYETESALSAQEALQSLLAYMDNNGLDVLHTSTQIIIVPGYKYKIVNALITNFHQPKSTLLLLVSAFIGDDWRRVYRFALDNDYRFLSYGDACLLIP
ncbi:MAG: S-adenosylmethionine:tRNA ribosyltransferase-isomerase [Prevotella sp.]|nr:S-adenosylmethionine:tRNA ribosyltransferase-isomerase [Prevotella sp.]